MDSSKRLQVFLCSPELGIPSRALTLDPNLTFWNLKLSLLPEFQGSSTFFSSSGKLLSDFSTMSASRIRPFSTLTLSLRALGGGGDGGATGAESRDCYLNMYAVKKPDKVDPNETRLSKWTTCALSFEPLAEPCVIDRLGNVFNKESLLQGLLEKKMPKEFGHIRGLKDMIPIHLSEIPSSEGSETRFQCPITGLEFNGKYGFLALRGCGHVMSTKALKEVKSSTCLVCHREFSESDKLVLNGSPEEVKALRERMAEERGKTKEKKSGACLSGTKHGNDEKYEVLADCGKENGVKKFKAVDIAPPNANKEVYASIFTSSKKSTVKETYMCRSLPLGRN